jgi:hypothetical protein
MQNMPKNLVMADAVSIANMFRLTEQQVRKAALSNEFKYDFFGTGYIDTESFMAWIHLTI